MKKLLFALPYFLVCNLFAVTYTVTTTTDNGGDGAGTSGSLRYCIQQGLSTAGPHTINFNLTGTAPFTINVTGGTFNLFQYDFTINATTQTGWAPAQDPVVILRGNGGGDGFQLNNSNRSTISGFIFQNYQNGIVVNNNISGHIFENCWFGLNATGTSKAGNTISEYGLLLQGGAPNIRVGSTTVLDNSTRCVISGCNKTGIYANGAGTGLIISNCYVGTDAAGTGTIGNGTNEPQNHHGIDINNTPNVQILNSVISANTGAGIEIRNCSGASIRGNKIGMDVTGTVALGNRAVGIRARFGGGHTIGGTTAADRNIISANGDPAIPHGNGPATQYDWYNMCGIYTEEVSTTQIMGNYIGTDISGVATSATIGNLYAGVKIVAWNNNGAENNIVGGVTTNHRNVIGGNGFRGFAVNSAFPGHGVQFQTNTLGYNENNSVLNNYIGIGADGTSNIGNKQDGVSLFGSVRNITIGDVGMGNKIGWNSFGIFIQNNCQANLIKANYIGTSADGTLIAPNNSGGVCIQWNSTGNYVGRGLVAGDGNVISGNAGAPGVIFRSGGSPAGTGNNNFVYNNIIGLQADGVTALSSTNLDGVYIQGGSFGNTIGGTTSYQRNIISANLINGIHFDNGDNNTVRNNYIGIDVAGIAKANINGIFIENGSSGNSIGIANGGNIISGNTNNGIFIDGAANTSNTIKGNKIGTNIDGTSKIPNKVNGVWIRGVSAASVAVATYIGGVTLPEGNLISGNGQMGVKIENAAFSRVYGNTIGTDTLGLSDLGNGGHGVDIFAGSNSSQVVGNLISGNGDSTILGNAISVTNTNNMLVQTNLLGVNRSATAAIPNLQAGYSCTNSNNSTIGGAAALNRNIISGNDDVGVYMNNSDNNNIQNNYIGINITGNAAIANKTIGVYITTGCSGNTFTSNVIAGNGTLATHHGIIVDASTANTFSSNNIGVGADNTTDLGHLANGLHLQNGSADNIIGTGNRIGYNNGNGIEIDGATSINNSIHNNSIFCNDLRGIVLSNGGNNDYAAPTFSASGTDIRAEHTTAGTYIEIYTLDGCNDCQTNPNSDNLQGRTLVFSGTSPYTFTPSPGVVYTSIASVAGTTTAHNTSEFSTCYTLCASTIATPSIAISPERNICANTSAAITLTASGSGVVTYDWREGSCSGAIVHTGDTYTLSATPSVTTHYFVQARDGCGSSQCKEDSIIVHNIPLQPDSVSSPSYCSGTTGNITLTTVGGTANGATLSWYTESCGVTLVHSGSSFTLPIPSASIDYFVRYESPYCGNTLCEQGTVTINAIPVTSINGTTTFCEDSTQQFSTTGTASSTYQWSFNPAAGTTIANPTSNVIDLTISDQDGFLSLTETISGCSTTVFVPVTAVIRTGPKAFAGLDRDACLNSVMLTANNSAGTWSDVAAAATFAPKADTFNVTVSGLSNSINQFVWTVTGTCGYIDDDTVSIRVGPSDLDAEANAPSDTQCVGSARAVSVSIVEDGSGDYTYVWTSSDNSVNITTTNPDISLVTGSGLVTLYLTVIDNQYSGCSVSDSATMFTVGDQELVIPNLITPNGDGKNDIFELKDLTDLSILPGSYLEVTNRWGQYVYKDKSYGNTWQGENANDGMYYYYLKTGCGNRAYKGWVQILR